MKILNVFNSLTLKQIFWKTKTFLKKLEYSFLFGSTEIENTSFPYKTAISEANVKTNKMVTTKSTYRKECNFSGNYFIFLKILFQFKNSYKEMICCTNNPKVYICTFHKCSIFIWLCFSPVSNLNDIFNIILNIWHKFKFITPCWSNYFKFIVLILFFYLFPHVINR